MNNQNNEISDIYLHAFVDGQLDQRRSDYLGEILAKNSDKLNQVEQYVDFNTTLHNVFDPILDEPVPSKFIEFVEQYDDDPILDIPSSPEPILSWIRSLHHRTIFNLVSVLKFTLPNISSLVRGPFGTPRVSFAVGILGIFIGSIITANFTGVSDTGKIMLAQQHAIDAHFIYSREKRHSVEVPATEKEHLMKWLSKRLNEKVGPAVLRRFGFSLIGGRLLPVNKKHAGMYIYKNANNVHLSVYMSAEIDSGLTNQPFCTNQNELNICAWKKNALSYFVISEIHPYFVKRIADYVNKEVPMK